MEFLCDENNTAAPCVGCGCRQCYRARERSLDPELISLTRHLTPAKMIVRHNLMLYLGGKMEWAILQREIIKSLVKHSDESFQREMKIAQLQPLSVVLKGGGA